MYSCHVDKVFLSVLTGCQQQHFEVFFFFFFFCPISALHVALVMSDPSRQPRRYPSRVPVRISRNYTKLPPILQTARSTDTNNDSSRSAVIIHPAENSLPPTRLTPLAHLPKDEEDHSLKPTLTSTTNDTNHHSSISIDASEFWVKLGQHIAKEPLPNPNDRGHQRTPNKVVRIFVSSTFTDFFNEREVLIKQVIQNFSTRSRH